MNFNRVTLQHDNEFIISYYYYFLLFNGLSYKDV